MAEQFSTKDADGNTLPEHMRGEDVLREYATGSQQMHQKEPPNDCISLSARLNKLREYVYVAADPESFAAWERLLQPTGSCFLESKEGQSLILACNAHALKVNLKNDDDDEALAEVMFVGQSGGEPDSAE